MLIRQETVEFVISNTREREVRKGSGVGGGGGGACIHLTVHAIIDAAFVFMLFW